MVPKLANDAEPQQVKHYEQERKQAAHALFTVFETLDLKKD